MPDITRREMLTMTGIGLGMAVAGATPSASAAQASAQAKRPLEGVKLVVGGPPGPAISGPFRNHGPKWEEKTRARIEIVGYPTGDLFDKIRSAIATGTGAFDVILFSTGWAADIMGSGYLREIPKEVIAKLDWNDILPIYRERLLTWMGKTYGFPYDGDLHMYYYRKDLLADKKNKAKFKAKYGYEWDEHTGARTWEEYRDIAEFFTGWDWNGDGKPDYGAVETMGRKKWSFYFFFSRASAYGKHPEDVAFFFDPDTMEPRISSPAFVQALQDWVNIVPFVPEGGINNGTAELRRDFAGGKAAQAFEWADTGILTKDPKASVVKDKVGFAPLPGAKKVYNYRAKKWDDFPKGSRAPFLAFGGWTIGVTRTTKHPEAAFDLATFFGNKEMGMTLVTETLSGCNPYRQSQMTNFDPWVKSGFSEESAKEYLKAIGDSFRHPNAIIDLRIPGTAEYFDTMEVYTSQALAKQVSPQAAMAAAAKDWNAITDRLGRDKQKKYYRDSLGLK